MALIDHLAPAFPRDWRTLIRGDRGFGEVARQTGTLIIILGVGHKERWMLLTDCAHVRFSTAGTG
ncbi:MAG: hypothetical protein WCF99_00125 [Chloroflexales bacterium]